MLKNDVVVVGVAERLRKYIPSVMFGHILARAPGDSALSGDHHVPLFVKKHALASVRPCHEMSSECLEWQSVSQQQGVGK